MGLGQSLVVPLEVWADLGAAEINHETNIRHRLGADNVGPEPLLEVEHLLYDRHHRWLDLEQRLRVQLGRAAV